MRVLPALLAVAVVTAGVAVPVVAAFATPSSPDGVEASDATGALGTPRPPGQAGEDQRSPLPSDTVSVLAVQPNATNRSTIRATHVDLGPSVAFETNESSYRLETIRTLNEVREADDPAAALDQAMSRLDAEANALGRSQRAAIEAYLAEEADARTTLVALARIDHEARALERRRMRLMRLAEELGVEANEERSAAIRRELGTYTGPVRERVHDALTGDAPPTRFYLSAAPRSVTLSTIADGEYLRETYRGDLRRTGPNQMSEQAVRAVIAESYPVVWAHRENVSVDPGGNAVVNVRYDGGRLTAHVGAGNDRVFRDVHRRDIDRVATNQTAVNVRDGLRVSVNRTYAGAPMRISVVDDDGDPVRARVSVGPEGGDSVAVGTTTADDGVVWALTPDERFTVVAIHGESSVVFITMDPLATPRVNEEG